MPQPPVYCSVPPKSERCGSERDAARRGAVPDGRGIGTNDEKMSEEKEMGGGNATAPAHTDAELCIFYSRCSALMRLSLYEPRWCVRKTMR